MTQFINIICLCSFLASCSLTESRLQKERHALVNRILDSVDKGADVLIVIDGMVVPAASQKDLRMLFPIKLTNARLMDWQDAKTLYGSSAKPITLLINTDQFKNGRGYNKTSNYH